MKFPHSIQNLINLFSELPSVGPKTAERFVFYLLNKKSESVSALAEAIQNLHPGVVKCGICLAYAEKNPCVICSDEKRNNALLCIIADTRALAVIESSGQFGGRYYVLGGELNAIEGIGPDQLATKPLLDLINKNGIREIILAFNPTIEGESTALYLSKIIRALQIENLKITRIARGLPMGADIEYADEATLGNALKYRNEV
jgi:recombination protein RecR